MTTAKTLFELAGIAATQPDFQQSILILVDYQQEYCQGPLTLDGHQQAIAAAQTLLAQARQQNCPVIHVAHAGNAGGPFDRQAERGQFVADLTPQDGEKIIEKRQVSAFVGTDLLDHLHSLQRSSIIIAGFMTHNCVSSTARTARDLGWQVYVQANACATRDLPDPRGGIITAAELQRASLLALSDRNATILYGP